MSSVMRTQRQEWIDFLEAIPFFDPIPILAEDHGDISNESQRRLGILAGASGKVGVAIFIGTVVATPDTEAEFGPVLQMQHIARVIENVPINRAADRNGTLITYDEVIEKIAGYTQGQFVPLSGNSPFMIVPPGIKEHDERFLTSLPVGGPGKDIFFSCSGQFASVLTQIATPIITLGANVSIACATAGAAIFYTVDGTKPTPRKTLYTAPFVRPAGGTIIRARAYLAGYLASEIASATA